MTRFSAAKVDLGVLGRRRPIRSLVGAPKSKEQYLSSTLAPLFRTDRRLLAMRSGGQEVSLCWG